MTNTDAKGPERIVLYRTSDSLNGIFGCRANPEELKSFNASDEVEYVRQDLYDQLKQERDRYRDALEKYAQTAYWIRPRDGSTYREVFLTNAHGFEIAIKAINPQEHGGVG